MKRAAKVSFLLMAMVFGGSVLLLCLLARLPALSPEEITTMRRLNPKSPDEIEEEKAIQNFLEGKGSHESQGHAH